MSQTGEALLARAMGVGERSGDQSHLSPITANKLL